MPSTIPYDPSLTLGAIVNPSAIETLTQISGLNAEIDAAQENLNSFISMKRSIDRTIVELIDMEVDPLEIKTKSEEIKKAISKAAMEYAALRLENEAKIRPLKAKVQSVHQALDSPIDFAACRVAARPISADSLNMESQYFSFEQDEQGIASSMAAIKELISGAAASVGTDAATKMATAGVSQIAKQRQEHQIVGTLVIVAACTHKMAGMLAPLAIDVDRAVRIWNHAFPSDKLKPTDRAAMMAAAAAEERTSSQALHLLTGATYGSSFVGMVHIRQNDTTGGSFGTGSGQSMTEVAESMQEKFKIANWLEGESGGLGADPEIVSEIKRLLGKQEFAAHVTLITMGIVPDFGSSELSSAVGRFTQFADKEMMSSLAGLSTMTGPSSVQGAADESKSLKRANALRQDWADSVLKSTNEIDVKKNNAIDLNSLVTAFDNYLKKVSAPESTGGTEGVGGVPITYFVKPLTKAELAEMWVTKHNKQQPSTEESE